MYLDLIYVFICNLSIYILCLSVCLFVSNKRQHGWTDQALILCGTLHDPREGLWMIKISKISLQQQLIFIKFWKTTKYCYKITNFFVIVFFQIKIKWRNWMKRQSNFYLGIYVQEWRNTKILYFYLFSFYAGSPT